MIRLLLRTAKTAAIATIALKVAASSADAVDKVWDRVTKR